MTRILRTATGAPVFAFKRGPGTARKRRTNPEAALQVQIKQFLIYCLPPEIEWTSSLTGQNLTNRAAELSSAKGVRPGWPDMQFIINRRTYYIELKAPLTATPRHPGRLGTLDDPGLSPDQRRVLSALHPASWAICRSVDEVAAFLTGAGVKLRAMPFAPQSPA